MKVRVQLVRYKMAYCENVDGCWQVVTNEVEMPKEKTKKIRELVESSGRKLIDCEKVGETLKVCDVPTEKILEYAVENKEE